MTMASWSRTKVNFFSGKGGDERVRLLEGLAMVGLEARNF